MLNLLTATGCRPHAWALCERLMQAQDYPGRVHWVIVDDGEVQQAVTLRRAGWTFDIVRPQPFWSGDNTQARNLAAGLATLARAARVAVIEDDDFYSPHYLSAVAHWLDDADIAGEAHARYYNIATRRWGAMRNEHHASLCSTAVKGTGLDALRDAVSSGKPYIDVELWRSTGALYGAQHVVGIKGLPGRSGIGAGHLADFGQHDPTGAVLREWIGNAAEIYLRIWP